MPRSKKWNNRSDYALINRSMMSWPSKMFFTVLSYSWYIVKQKYTITMMAKPRVRPLAVADLIRMRSALTFVEQYVIKSVLASFLLMCSIAPHISSSSYC